MYFYFFLYSTQTRGRGKKSIQGHSVCGRVEVFMLNYLCGRCGCSLFWIPAGKRKTQTHQRGGRRFEFCIKANKGWRDINMHHVENMPTADINILCMNINVYPPTWGTHEVTMDHIWNHRLSPLSAHSIRIIKHKWDALLFSKKNNHNLVYDGDRYKLQEKKVWLRAPIDDTRSHIWDLCRGVWDGDSCWRRKAESWKGASIIKRRVSDQCTAMKRN